MLDNHPKVSVVTPSLNSAAFISENIHSVLRQNYHDIEHIIVDGGSTDSTVNILQKYSHLRWVSENDRGQSDALNKGFRLARGEIICWLNSDDTLADGDTIEEVVRVFERDQRIAVVYGDFNIIDENGQIIGFVPTKEFDLMDQLLSNLVSSAGVFIRRAVLEQVGYLDLGLDYAMDYDLWLRISKLAKIQRIPKIVANFRMISGTKSVAHPERFWPEIIQSISRFYSDEDGLQERVKVNKQLIFGHNYWQAGLAFYAVGSTGEARYYCEEAIKRYHFLDHYPEMAFSDINHWAIDVLGNWFSDLAVNDPEKYVKGVLRDLRSHHLLSWSTERRALASFYAALAFERYRQKDLWETRVSIGKCFSANPSWLRNRGLLSIAVETALGSNVANLIRNFL